MGDDDGSPTGAGETLGRYRLIERLGAGAMGDVYRARDDSLGREVAIKLVRAVARSEFQLEMFHRRFENEARALAALSHPNVVNVFDVGVDDDTPYLVMELVEGRSLADRLEPQERLTVSEVCALGGQIGAALSAAHARGIVHRDVKPGNILEAGDGAWKLADFGVAHVPDSSLTLTGQFLGSPAYAAPEALGRGDFGPPSDVFGLGVTLYEAATGARPYGADGVLTAGALGADTEPRSVLELRPDMPPHIGAAIMAALARDAAHRSSAEQLVSALSGQPAPVTVIAVPVPTPAAPSRRRFGALAIAGGILLIGIAVGAGLSSSDSSPSKPPAPSGSDLPLFDRTSTARSVAPAPPRRELSDKDAKKIDKEWRQVDKKLGQGKDKDALKHLRKVLSLDPSDDRARALYRELSGEDWDPRRDDHD